MASPSLIKTALIAEAAIAVSHLRAKTSPPSWLLLQEIIGFIPTEPITPTQGQEIKNTLIKWAYTAHKTLL